MKIELKYDSTFKDLLELCARADVPNAARMKVYHYPGDQREPSYTSITFIWEEQ